MYKQQTGLLMKAKDSPQLWMHHVSSRKLDYRFSVARKVGLDFGRYDLAGGRVDDRDALIGAGSTNSRP
jgi:hypothetical protein